MQKLLILLLCILFFLNYGISQQRTINGKVTSANTQKPIQNVTVSYQENKRGTVTDVNGNYSITIPSDTKNIMFSHVGYTAKVEVIGSSSVLNISLVPSSEELDEVIVTTAFGIKRTKRALGYSTQTVQSDELIDKGDGSILNLLQGKIAGAEITGAGGSAGASTNIILRGIGSISGSNQPLFVIDGVPMINDMEEIVDNNLFTNQPPNRAMDLDPNTIESIDILQGPAGAALYGSRASAGAIIITTKKGSVTPGQVTLTAKSSYDVQNIFGLPKLQNSFGGGANGLFAANAVNAWGPSFDAVPSLANGLIVSTATSSFNGVDYVKDDTIAYLSYPDNLKNYFQQGHTWANNISLFGGAGKNKYGLMLGQSSQQGILPKSDFNRLNVRFNFSSEMSKKLTLSGTISYLNTFFNNSTTQGAGVNSGMDQLWNVMPSVDLDYYKKNYKNPDGSNNWLTAADNPYFVANENDINTKMDRFMGNTKVNYRIAKWLTASYTLGIDQYSNNGQRIIAVGSTQEPGFKGSVTEFNVTNREINGDFILTATKNRLFVDGLRLNALVGQNVNMRNFKRINSKASSLVIPGFYNVSNGESFNGTSTNTSQQRLLGYYGQLSFDYNRYLYLELTGRVDQSSTLPKNNNTYFYPSVSTSFIFTDALKIQSDFFSFGKLRAAYARVGKDASPYSLDTRRYATAGFGNNVAAFTFPYGDVLGFTLSGNIGNPVLKPEFTYSYELGLSLGFFNNRLNFEGAIYKQGSKNQIINAGLAPSTGFNNMVANIGEIENKGVELTLTAEVINSKYFKWSATGNFSKNKNKVVAIAPGVTSFNIAGGRNYAAMVPSAYVGLPYGVILGNEHYKSPDGEYLINPNTGLYLTEVEAAQVIADPNRKWTAGLTNNFKYKNFSLSALVDLKVGGQIASWTAAVLRSKGLLEESAKDRLTPRILKGVIDMGDGKYVPNNIQITPQQYWQSWGGQAGTDFNMFDATTFRIREVTLGYTFTRKVLNSNVIKNIRIAVYGRNIFFYAPNSLIDPEVNTQGMGNIRGIELKSTPTTRNFGASVLFTF